MSSFPVYANPTPVLLRVEVDPYADMHDPERPYRIVIPNPDMNIDEEGDAGRNLTRAELVALHVAVGALLSATAEGGEDE